MEFRGAVLAALAALSPGAAFAEVPPVVTTGPTGVATALPDEPVPPGRACVVQLFADQQFIGFTPKAFHYAPPPECPGPWAKVVLRADYSVNAGRQFDRTASIWLGGVNLYFGTTQEPSAAIAPQWHVQRDVTDYSALLRRAADGRTILGNVVDSTYTGIITGSARLVFYPGQAHDLPDRIIPLSSNPDGDYNYIHDGTARAGRTLTFPRNMVALYMDVIAQSQSSDEFWQFCVPSSIADAVYSCGGSGFRQTVVYIDGQPAGIAPVYPWIYTGGISPALWRPIPGVQTLAFEPFRVNLTPFAGQLDDGTPHTVELGVVNSGDYFATAANLLVYQDGGRAVVTGRLVANSLVADPGQIDTISYPGENLTSVTTRSRRDYGLSGYVETSRGRIATGVRQTVDFVSAQDFIISDTQYRQTLRQDTTVDTTTTTTRAGTPAVVARRRFDFPLTFDYDDRYGEDGSETLDMRADQGYSRQRSLAAGGRTTYQDVTADRVTPHVRYNWDSSGALTISPWTSAEDYRFGNSLGECYSRQIASDQYVVTSVTNGEGCGGGNRYDWQTPSPGTLAPFGLDTTEAATWSW
jgi:hypothetical protein